MNNNEFHQLFITVLSDIYNAEEQLVEALPEMIESASDEKLQAALAEHLEQTRGQIERLDEAFELLGEDPLGETCEGMEGIIEEGKEVLEAGLNSFVTDAGIIAAAQKVEHYEIASYGSAIEWAKTMNHDEVADLLKENLDEEEKADKKLSGLGEGSINKKAFEGESD